MIHRARVFIFLLGLLVFSSIAFSQTPAVKTTPQKATKVEKGARPTRERADPLAEQRRNTAISLLTTLADEAKNYQDQVLRARVLARAADALWSGDSERARNLFQRAWDAAVIADEDAARRMEEDIRKQQKTTGSAVVSSPPNIRNEVLRLAAKHDRVLGEGFLKKLEEAKEREAAAKAALNRDPWMASVSQSQRLRLATQLLQDGDTERALQFADPALTSVSMDSMNFLSALRQKDATAADQRYSAMLTRAEMDPASDANTVSGLSSYAFTPFLYIVFHPRGGASQMQQRAPTPPPDLPPGLQKAFFTTAVQILSRPLPPAEQDTTSAGRAGKYMVIRRLLPLFEQHAPERVAELRVMMTALMSDVPANDRTGENRAVTHGIVPEDTTRDPMQGMQERLNEADNVAERDAIYVDMAASLAGSGDPRARELVDKIEDSDLRQQTRAYTDFEYLDNALQKKDVPEAIRLARSGELTNFQRVYGLTQVARQLIKSDRERAVELLEEALAAARRIGGGEPERPRALTAISSVFIEADRTRAWELISEVVKAGNSAEGFSGDDARISVMLRFKNGAMMRNSNAADFDLLGVFRTLAKSDLYPAIEAAKNFTNEVPRANAILAIARTVLEEKQKQ